MQEIAIGGGQKYESLRNGYVLAAVNPNYDQTEVAVRGYLITNDATFDS